MAHIASHCTCVNSAPAGTIFGTTDVYELGFSYLSISIFTLDTQHSTTMCVFNAQKTESFEAKVLSTVKVLLYIHTS